MTLFEEERTGDLIDQESGRQPEVPLDPNFAVMSIRFVRAILIGAVACMIAVSLLLHFKLGWAACVIPTALYLVFLALFAVALAHPFTGRSKPRFPAPDTSTLFHVFQIGAVGTVFGVAFLMGSGNSPGLAWVTLVLDLIVGLFYLCYLGFTLALRYPPPKSVFVGTVWIALCVAYTWHTISR